MPVTKIYLSTDGACRSNGTEIAIAAIGVSFLDFSGWDISTVLHITQPTNQKAELTAAIRGLEQSFIIANSADMIKPSARMGNIEVQLRTDSQYVVSGITDWIVGWKKNKYKTSGGTPVKNATLFRHLDELINKTFAEMKWTVKVIHTPRSENQNADGLANFALDKNAEAAAKAAFNDHNKNKNNNNNNKVPADTVARWYVARMAERLHAAWIVSNIPSQYMCHQRELFTDFAPIFPFKVEALSSNLGGTDVYAIGTGKVKLKVRLPDQKAPNTVELENVLYVPDLFLNIIPKQRLPLDQQSGVMTNDGRIIARVARIDNFVGAQLLDEPCAFWLLDEYEPDTQRYGIPASAWITGISTPYA